MSERSVFLNLSPLDHRYYLSNKSAFDELARYLSEDAVINYTAKVEEALLLSHIDELYRGDPERKKAVAGISNKISPADVYAEEEKTQHNIRALVNVIKRYVPENLQHLVHLGATSVDILDTASSLRCRDAVRRVIIPLLIDIEELLIRISREEADTSQVGRTHGQHAVPITFGFALSEYVSRLGKSAIRINTQIQDVRGQLSGAVGAYNATSLLVTDPLGLEKRFLEYLDLKPSDHSTQLVEPEYLLRVLLEINIAFGILANLADDLRNLQRSEIGEVQEAFNKDQVGSSTMPQKRNPWNSEHVKSMWKAFSPRILSFYMDQISEHQRDLTNSASSRFIADYLAGFTAALVRMKKILSNFYVDRKKMEDNVLITGDLVLAEAAYILLSASGETDAHEVIRNITLQCEKNKESLVSAIRSDTRTWDVLTKQLSEKLGIDPDLFFSHPSYYCGRAKEKCLDLCDRFAGEMEHLKKEIP